MKLRKRKKRVALFGFLIVLALLLLSISGCSNVSYFSQAIVGHFRIMRNRVPIEDVLKTNDLSADSKDKLKLVLEVRAYAGQELGLPKNKSYTVYSTIHDEYAGWNVYAAPRFSVEPVKWCFPIAGCVVYRGFFSKTDALAFAGKSEEKGLDVFIGPFSGYSTLGWYNDPVLSSQLRLNTIRLAGLVIHELAHQKYYVSGDSRFSEAFAVTVERAGVLRWLKSTGRDALAVQAVETWAKDDRMASRILKARTQLMGLYASGLDPEAVLQKRMEIFQDLKASVCGVSCAGISLPKTNGEEYTLNNAYLIPVDTYYSLVPVFQTLLDSLDGNLPQFYKKVEELGKLPSGKRQHELESLKNKMEAHVQAFHGKE
jgi:predicted aminopeptidase